MNLKSPFFSTWLGLNWFSVLVLSNGKYFFDWLPIRDLGLGVRETRWWTAHTHHINNFASLFQVVKMFMVVVVIFAICWLPYHVYFIYTYHNKEVTTKPYIQHVYLSFYWLAMANAMINPAIYYGMNARYVQWDLRYYITCCHNFSWACPVIFHGLTNCKK